MLVDVQEHVQEKNNLINIQITDKREDNKGNIMESGVEFLYGRVYGERQERNQRND